LMSRCIDPSAMEVIEFVIHFAMIAVLDRGRPNNR
jgi:hypothetical protein